VPVAPSTLFPADNAARAVVFGFRDDADNLGTASASVRVKDTSAPTVTVAASPAALPADRTWKTVRTTVTARDGCGGAVALRLLSIESNAPALDAADVRGAAYGTADVEFSLFTRPAPTGPREWRIRYEAKDLAGNTASAVVLVQVH
jgi:hypothetical protein